MMINKLVRQGSPLPSAPRDEQRAANGDGTAVTILLDDDARRALQAHAHRRRDREVAGFLVGRQPEKQPDGRYVVAVADYIEAQFTISRGGSVTLTPESWHFAHVELAHRHPGHLARLVGWAHTHPGFGIFLSDPDLFIHRAFFRQPWQIAAVVDPITRTGGFFGWDAALGGVHRSPFVWHWE
jgi:proteasome lid subunit RPN8/RPN11